MTTSRKPEKLTDDEHSEVVARAIFDHTFEGWSDEYRERIWATEIFREPYQVVAREVLSALSKHLSKQPMSTTSNMIRKWSGLVKTTNTESYQSTFAPQPTPED